ncbi:MAG: hypothetical protein Q7T15_04630 [Microcella sp.]|uniref:hypothetical protein n=1 Tax=Microcella sp. TaxID=1913979 RepID=UPI00271FD7D3|nr:hypothetical protein [Microcella sp.]MDO8337524.1 hypothetical protein [Microcella sp.]
MVPLLILSALAIVAIAATASTVLRDGYRRAPTISPRREYERAEHYRARSAAP